MLLLRVTRRDPGKALPAGQEGIDDRRVEMAAAPVTDEPGRGLQIHRRLIYSTAYYGIEHISERHQPRRDGNGIACQTGRVALAIPFLVVAEGNPAGDPQERTCIPGVLGFPVAHALDDLRDRLLDRGGADDRVRLHDLHLLGGQAARFKQDRIGDPDLA